ncbi:MAG: metallopeptidase family protein [Acidimicrobiales bacterium]
MRPLPADRFEQLVADALDQVPEPLAELVDNVVVVVEDRSEDEPELLGLYEGTPLTEREAYGGMELPDRITIYRLPLCELARDEDEIVEEVLVTVVHEVAHHFGIEDDRLHDLGWA